MTVEEMYQRLEDTIRAYNPGANFTQIRAAFDCAEQAHRGQLRKDGTPYITHPLNVAQIVAEELHLDSESIIAALLHDTIEDTDVTHEDIARQFSENNRSFVEGLPKQSLQNKKDIAPAKEQCHVDLFSYSVWEADCPKSKESQFVVFDYSNRNPLNHNASFFICPAPSSSYEQPELQK